MATRKKTPTKRKPKGNGTNGLVRVRAQPATAGTVTVRMYNVGLGDCFLLGFPAPDRPRWVLIDCGSHPSGPGPREGGIRDVVSDVIADVTHEQKARIDVVICTHRHSDHVSGFADARWKGVDVGEVWMPWTEHPHDAEATRIREAQSVQASYLKKLKKRGLKPKLGSIADNNLVNAKAMATLHNGFKGNAPRQFLPERNGRPSTFTTPLLPDLKVHVMGPSDDPEIIRDMDPPKGQAYLQRMAAESGKEAPLEPFRRHWLCPPSQLPPHLRALLSTARSKEIEDAGDLDLFGVVTSLETSVNGTSLVIMFELGRAFMLFAGDSQWGTWTSLMENAKWRALLSKTTFYKIAHHGSHNATVPEVVQNLGAPFLGMVSTRAKTKDWDIPRGPVLGALRKRKGARVVRSDEADVPDRSVVRGGGSYYVDATLAL